MSNKKFYRLIFRQAAKTYCKKENFPMYIPYHYFMSLRMISRALFIGTALHETTRSLKAESVAKVIDYQTIFNVKINFEG